MKYNFSSLETALQNLSLQKTHEAGFEVVKEVLLLLGIGESVALELFLDPDRKLAGFAWMEHNKTYNKPAGYELLKKNTLPLDAKLYFVEKKNRQRNQQLVALTPNYEDSPKIFLDKNVGIDFVIDQDFSGLTIVLSKDYNARTLTLEKTLTNTQKTILEKWAQNWGMPKESDLYGAEWKDKLHKTLWESFDISEVNKEFYRGIAERFTLLVQHLSKHGKTENFAKGFANRLLGRLIFCWFLDKKEFLNPEQKYLKAEGANATDYYRNTLQKLFFLTLNTPQSERHKIPQALIGGLDEMTPYLNGGLFEPKDGDELLPHEKDIFPEAYFTDLFGFLSHYHFTTDENTTDYQAVAIDPEMLGRIFENLLAEQVEETGEQARKAKGAFYTPREIVDYMCRESLWEYLKQSIEERDQTKIRTLLFEKKEHEFGKNDRDDTALKASKAKLLEALDTAKIIDPAVGSGAFPMGMLQLMLKVYARLDGRYAPHETKLQIIKENLFGVDIEPMAVEICRLRAWLSIMVDEKLVKGEENSGVHPLPNLDFKFVCANSLIPAPKEEKTGFEGMFEDFSQKFEEKTSAYFDTTTPEEKKNEKTSIKKLIGEKVQEKISAISSLSFSLNTEKKFHDVVKKQNAKQIDENSREMSLWASYENLLEGGKKPVEFFDPKYFFPSAKNGFDIVIGNPPYVQLQKFARTQTQKDLEAVRYTTFAKTGDLYCLFYERGLQIAKPNTGLLCYITSNKWMRAGYGEKLRAFFARKNPLQLLDFGGFKVFASATVDTNILIIKNLDSVGTHCNASLHACHFQNDYQKNDDLKEYFTKNAVDFIPNTNGESWFLGSSAEIALKKKIETVGTPLKEWDVKIYRGVLTGLNEAFIINQAKRDELVQADPKSAEIIKPILRGRDIKRYGYEFGNLYLLMTGFDLDVPKEYPTIFEHLKQFEEKAKKRDDQGKNWWNLRSCGYYEEFEKEKVVWIELVDDGRFAFVESGIYMEATTFLMTFERPKFIVGILNSKIVNWYFDKICGESGVGTNRWKKFYVEAIPIPTLDTPQKKAIAEKIENLVEEILSLKNPPPDKGEMEGVSDSCKTPLTPLVRGEKNSETEHLENQIDELVFELYELTEEERRVVLGE